MKLFKGKIWAALGSLMDHAAAATASGNNKGSSAADLRGLWASRDLRIDAPRCSCSPLVSGAGPCSFLHGYSAYLEERMQWVINQAGNLEPARPRPPRSSSSSYDHAAAAEPLIFKLAMSQRLLDLAIQLLPDNNTSASAAARSAFGIVLRESFKVYDAFKDGLDALLRSRAGGGGKASRVSAHEILKKACAQTLELKEFYHRCKKSNVNKSLEYPVVRVVTSAMELIMPPVSEEEDDGEDDDQEGRRRHGGGGAEKATAAVAQASDVSGGAPFATKLETTISTLNGNNS
ncbi:hypothetical protein E2562_008574 [Oryza meyeriana var. granulata]|uniref:AP180 N-terminal homology (ANTH) domain-containing protein n=1 Tax=Oryza meyeriana var. granulata TaxID=110450 RepID=A0A6G1C442_9ORYZ|nr:hypothetical protein E2562_008574 [Oryza meyeriana var. granulata]